MKILAAIGHLILAGAIVIILFFVGGIIADSTGTNNSGIRLLLPVVGVIPYLIYACKSIFGDNPKDPTDPMNK